MNFDFFSSIFIFFADITDTLMASAKYRVDGKAREIFFFE